jgi:hypothetical protein
MRLKWTVLAVAAMAAGSASGAAAQSQGWALTPFVGYIQPLNNLVEYADASVPQYLQVESSGGVMVGVNGELGLSKQFALSGFVSSTVGLTQKGTWHYRLGAPNNFDYQYGMATTQFGATFVVRPLGRLPNGAPKVFYLEAGGGMNLLQVSDVVDRSGSTSNPLSWDASSPIVILGGGFTFRIGPRSTLVLFARYNMGMNEYTSDGLDDWNSVPPPDPGQKVNLLLIGAGLRTGH